MLYEVHLIDSPGFDDDASADAEVLSSIAEYVNFNYMLKERLAGVLYLHDITRAKMGGVGKRNIRMLEQMIGVEKFPNCTIVTTKWGCTTRQDEEQRENTLRTIPEFFGSMLEKGPLHHGATMRRFDPKSRGTALEIITPYLENKFTPYISKQMADPKGPKLSLGETAAGKVVDDHLKELAETKLAEMKQELEKVKAGRAVLSQKYDETLFAVFKQKRKELCRRICLQRSGRWIMRTSIVGGAIVASVLTMGPGASVFALEPMFEQAVRGQRKNEHLAKRKLEAEFKNESKDASRLKTKDPKWLWDSKVQNMDDLDNERYRIKSGSSEALMEVIMRGGTVGLASDGGEDGEGSMMIGKVMGSDYESTSEDGWSDMGDLSN